MLLLGVTRLIFHFPLGARANLTSLIASHVYDESISFVPRYISDNSGWDYFLSWWLPGDAWAWARTRITEQYAFEPNQTQRALLAIRDSTFTCNTRQLFDTYDGATATVSRYLLQYALGATLGFAVHGSDLLPTFWNSDVNVTALLESKYPNASHWAIEQVASKMTTFAGEYQTYLLGHATRDDPNALFNGNPPVPWPQGVGGDVFTNVMETELAIFSSWFDIEDDDINTAASCDFWQDLAANMTTVHQTAEGYSLKGQDGSARLEL